MSNTPQKAIMRFKEGDDFIQKFRTGLSSGKLKVERIGIFEVRKVAEREGVNIADGKRITIPAHKKIVFRPTKKLRDLSQTYGN